MPYSGEIIGAAINLTSTSRVAVPRAMKYYAACYGGGGSPFATELIGSKTFGSDIGSIFYNTLGTYGFESETGLITANSAVTAPVPFGRGSYIGIFVDWLDDAPSPPDVVVSGTLYVKINN